MPEGDFRDKGISKFEKVATTIGREQDGTSVRSFMINGELMGTCIVLAMEMTKTGKGIFIVKAPEDNDIDPSTGYLFPDDKVMMLMEGQEDFSAYERALKKVLEARQRILGIFGEDYAEIAAVEEMQKQVDDFRLGISF